MLAREGWCGMVALFDIGVEQRFEEFERTAPIRDHVRDFQVDAVAEVGHAHEHAIEIGMEPSADRQAFGLYLRDFISWFEVVPEQSTAQFHVEAREERDASVERALERFGADGVHEGRREAKDRLACTPCLGRIVFPHVV